MKFVIPFLCLLFLIGCSDNQPTEKTSTADTTTPVEVNQTSMSENNASSTQTTVAAASTPSVDGSVLFAQKCVSCHGAKAEKSALNKSKIIADFSEVQIKEALKGYQNGTYGKDMKAVMQGQAKGLNDAQIDALAKYISTL